MLCRADWSCSSSSSIRFLRISPKLVSWSNVVLLIWLVFLPPISWYNLPIAAMTRSSDVTPGFMRYLCLWKKIQKLLWLLILSSTLSRRDSAQMRCLKHVLCCSVRRKFFCGAACHGLTLPFLLVQTDMHCSCAGRTHPLTSIW